MGSGDSSRHRRMEAFERAMDGTWSTRLSCLSCFSPSNQPRGPGWVTAWIPGPFLRWDGDSGVRRARSLDGLKARKYGGYTSGHGEDAEDHLLFTEPARVTFPATYHGSGPPPSCGGEWSFHVFPEAIVNGFCEMVRTVRTGFDPHQPAGPVLTASHPSNVTPTCSSPPYASICYAALAGLV